MALRLINSITNQRLTPAFYSDIFANRPAFGFVGRVFISTDTGQIFEDTGSAWTLIADAGVGGGTLASVTANGNSTTYGLFSNVAGVGTGVTAIPTQFPNSTFYSGIAAPAESHPYNAGVVGTALASATDNTRWGIGVYGSGWTNGGTRAAGVTGDGEVTNSADTGSAIGVRGYANATHAGGLNIGLLGNATGGANNYALYMQAGGMFSEVAQTWNITSNISSLNIVGGGVYSMLRFDSISNYMVSSSQWFINGGYLNITNSTGNSTFQLSNASGTPTDWNFIGQTDGSYNIFRNSGANPYFKISATGETSIISGTSTYFNIQNTSASGKKYTLNSDNSGNFNFYNDTVSPIYEISPTGTTKFFASVGINGTAGTNGSKLYVQGSNTTFFDTSGTRGIAFYPSSTGNIHLITSDYSGASYYPLALSSRGVNTDLYLNTNGNVGIGITSGSGKLFVKQSANTFGDGINSYYSANDSFIGIAHTGSIGLLSSSYNTTAGAYTPLGFVTSDIERMRITSGGNVLVNSTAALDASAKFQVNGNVYLGNQTAGAGNSTLKYNTSTGLVTVDTSARIFKKDIIDLQYGLDSVLKMSPKKYKWKFNDNEDLGFIADEMYNIVPEIVALANNTINETELKNGEPMGINYDRLVPILVKAIQEQQAQIEELRQIVATK